MRPAKRLTGCANGGVLWSDEENKILIDNYAFSSSKIMSKLLPKRTRTQISSHAGDLGIKKTNEFMQQRKDNQIARLNKEKLPPLFTEKEICLLKEKYAMAEYSEVLNMFPGRTRAQITQKAYTLGIKKENKVHHYTGRPDTFSQTERDLLMKMYPHKTMMKLLPYFPCKSQSQINKKASMMRLKKEPKVKLDIMKKNRSPKTQLEKRRERVFSNKSHADCVPVRVDSRTVIMARPYRLPQDVINEYNARQAAKFKF